MNSFSFPIPLPAATVLNRTTVKIMQIPTKDPLPLPSYAHEGDAGMDLRSDSPGFYLEPRETAIIPTGIAIGLPEGYEAQVRSRSGLAAKNEVHVLNSPGTVDRNYTGEIKVILRNSGKGSFLINRGDRIAQLVIAPVTTADLLVVNSLDETSRGPNGFGSSGVK